MKVMVPELQPGVLSMCPVLRWLSPSQQRFAQDALVLGLGQIPLPALQCDFGEAPQGLLAHAGWGRATQLVKATLALCRPACIAIASQNSCTGF